MSIGNCDRCDKLYENINYKYGTYCSRKCLIEAKKKGMTEMNIELKLIEGDFHYHYEVGSETQTGKMPASARSYLVVADVLKIIEYHNRKEMDRKLDEMRIKTLAEGRGER